MFDPEFGRRARNASSSTAREGSPVRPSSAMSIDGSSPSSPTKRRRGGYGDRFIPNREGVDLHAGFNMVEVPTTPTKTKRRWAGSGGQGEIDAQRIEEANRTFSTLLRSELFGKDIPASSSSMGMGGHGGGAMGVLGTSPSNAGFGGAFADPRIGMKTPPRSTGASSVVNGYGNTQPSTPSSRNLFTYMSPRKRNTPDGRSPGYRGIDDPTRDIYSMSPVRFDSQQLLLSPRKQTRQISKVPYKVLDAPDLKDDFYLNLVDWSSENVLGVGLGSSVYLWDATTAKVNKLTDLANGESVTSVSWIGRGTHVAVGSSKGQVYIFDAERQKRLRTMTGHTSRVGALAWNEHILSSGGRDRAIFHRDVRIPEHHIRKLTGHKQEVCGLKWNTEDGQLASGGNDNRLYVWNQLDDTPLHKFTDHVAAVKAIAWNPHQRGILASGGGTADKKIKFWNTITGQMINEVDTGSQVCNLAWSRNTNEIVSTHGFTHHQVIVWKYPSMQQVAQLTGHTSRVLYLAMSPDGQTIVTGAGDETLRFWNVFNKGKPDFRKLSLLDPYTKIR
ncbi:substrate-specific activator of APC-dependent proteolysis [Saitoella coloradoensis]